MQTPNILKIADIEHTEFSPAFLEWLNKEAQPTYTDQILKEDIYNIEDLKEGAEGGGYDVTEEITNQLEEVWTLCNETEVAYFRVIYH